MGDEDEKGGDGGCSRCCAGQSCACISCAFLAILFFLTTLAAGAMFVFLWWTNPDIKWTLGQGGGGGTDESGIVPTNFSNPGVFAELTPDEIDKVVTYLMEQKELNITPAAQATLQTSHIYSVELQRPSKIAVLNYLSGEEKPLRYADVILIRGDLGKPTVLEYSVGPISEIEGHVLLKTHNFKVRPRLGPGDVRGMKLRLAAITEPMYPLLQEKFGYGLHNCLDTPENCLHWEVSAPPVPTADLRNTWVVLRAPSLDSSSDSLPVYILIEDISRNPSDWQVKMIYYDNNKFISVAALMQAFRMKRLPRLSNQEPIAASTDEKDILSSKPLYTEGFGKAGPETVRMGERRYSIEGNTVTYLHWQFSFTHKFSTGLQVWDVRFQGDRIIYELSLQGIMSYYTGQDAFMMHARFLEDFVPLGMTSSELMSGVDCPRHADFFDSYYYNNMDGEIHQKKRHICIFEHDTNMPMKRHYQGASGERFKHYSGLSRKALVVRTIQVFRETDFIFDYCFYGNGAIEVKFATTGHSLGSFWSWNVADRTDYGYPTGEYQLSNIVQHMVNFKVDLDIQGTGNRHRVDQVRLEAKLNPYFSGEESAQLRVNRIMKEKEGDASVNYNLEEPDIYLFYNEQVKNRLNQNRAYRIKVDSVSSNMLQKEWKWENAVSWARHPLAVTQYKENEARSSSIFNAMNPYTPAVDFSTFINDESIVDKDLVAWVTIGTYRLPTTGEVPLASTLDTESSFKILPFNYFDNDVTKTLPDYVFAEPSGNGVSVTRMEGTESDSCADVESVAFEGDG